MPKLWGTTKDGQEMHLYRLENENGTHADVSDFGAILYNLYVKDKDGDLSDVVLGFHDAEGYFHNGPAFGAIVGPVANRVEGGRFEVNGKSYQLEQNEGNNTLHSGSNPFFYRMWTVDDYDGSSITLTVHNADGESGFPGNVDLTVTYALSNDDTLSISYRAISDQDTVLNVTNHSYFNLAGESSGLILDQIVWIDSDEFTITDEVSVPHGEIGKVAGTPLDFNTPKPLSDGIDDSSFDPIRIAVGFDHNFILKTTPGEVSLVASLEDKKSGRKMEVYTDMPGMQLYSGNFIPQEPVGKNGNGYAKRTGVAFETQFYPNSMNCPNFPQPRLKAGVEWTSTTAYKFSVE